MADKSWKTFFVDSDKEDDAGEKKKIKLTGIASPVNLGRIITKLVNLPKPSPFDTDKLKECLEQYEKNRQNKLVEQAQATKERSQIIVRSMNQSDWRMRRLQQKLKEQKLITFNTLLFAAFVMRLPKSNSIGDGSGGGASGGDGVAVEGGGGGDDDVPYGDGGHFGEVGGGFGDDVPHVYDGHEDEVDELDLGLYADILSNLHERLMRLRFNT